MNELLQIAAATLCAWLGKVLPKAGPDWWTRSVVEQLTFAQQRAVAERRVTGLEGLDLAGMLRIFDQNWYDLTQRETLPRDGRNWLKELQSVRNRWAHAPSGGISPQDAYRDADTLARILSVIGADSATLESVEVFKRHTLAKLAPPVPPPRQVIIEAPAKNEPVKETASSDPTRPSTTLFAVGQMVGLRSNPTVIVPILEVMLGSPNRYRVFEGQRRATYYESQLVAVEEPESEFKSCTAAELSTLLTSMQLNSPTASSLYSLNAGRVRFVPYQYRPVFKLIRADRPRLLVADEVGVGKTVEAGLMLKELQARHDVKSVLIICPKALVAERKWEWEMKRFGEHFTPIDGDTLRHCIEETHRDGSWPVQYERIILPFSLVDAELLLGDGRRRRGLLQLDEPPRFDLVIVDEAHHIRNSETYLHQAVRFFADNAEAVIFLTATPIQLGQNDLFTLLNVLRPDLIIDSPSFEQMAAPNPHINAAIAACRGAGSDWAEQVRARLLDVAGTSWGRDVLAVNPGFQQIYDALAVQEGEVLSRIKAIHALEEIYTFSSIINRTRRRDIGEFTTRMPETVPRDFTPSQQQLHDELLAVIARILNRLHGSQNVRFMMTTISRQAASSLYGLAPALEDMLTGKLDRLEAEIAVNAEIDALDESELSSIRSDIHALIRQAKALDPVDPKADAFMTIIGEKVVMPKNKVMVFSTFRHTLRYLADKLRSAGVRFALVQGDVDDAERSDRRRRFKLPKDDPNAVDVLLSSEVGCEGLDFQFCDCMLNYDLPWNPMRIEQRIGRIDRYGQESESIRIYNLITPGTIDADIYDRCLFRIGVFHAALGGSEEILGAVSQDLAKVADSYALNDVQRRERIQQLTDNHVRRLEEERRLEERQGELFGLNVEAASWDEKLSKARNYWLEPAAVAAAVSSYLTRRLGKDQEYLLGDKPLKTLRLSIEARAALLDDFRRMPKSSDPSGRSWDRWLKGVTPTLSVTFDQDTAIDNADATLISLHHPLVRQAVAYLIEPSTVSTQLRVTSDRVPPGIYPFAMYRWSKMGVKADEELVSVASNPLIAESLDELLQSCSDAPDLSPPGSAVIDELDAAHHARWFEVTARHAEENRQLVNARRQSLQASYQAREALLSDQLAAATNDRIRRMKEAERARMRADHEMRVSALDKAAESGDIRAALAIVGVVEVLPAAD